LSTPRATSLLASILLAVGGCGDKVPESATAKKIGEQPKQIIDKAAGDVTRALKTGTEARQSGDKKD
jgi:hypothetical protein